MHVDFLSSRPARGLFSDCVIGVSPVRVDTWVGAGEESIALSIPVAMDDLFEESSTAGLSGT